MNVLLSLILITTLSSCTRALDVMNLEVQRQPLALEDPRAPEIKNYDIYVITEENAQEVFDRLKEKNKDPVLFGLTDEGYETKSLNDKKTRNYLRQLQSIIEEYRDYYERDR